jgi:L-asparaginase II
VVNGAVVAEVVRSGFVEGSHHGSVVALVPDGSVAWSVGEVDAPVLPRSCNKPLQALGMLEQGLDLPPDLLAQASASHSGEPMHLDAVRRILLLAGLDESALQTPPALPGDDVERDAVLRAGGGPEPIYMDCSGKHAAMLLTCVTRGWDTTTYLDRGHPLQVALLASFAAAVGADVEVVATDGCGAPLFSASLTSLARGFQRLATAHEGPAHRVAEAIRAHPELVSGTRRDELRLLHALPGAIGKAGAEACYVVALPDGRAWALKIDDGGERARPVVMAAALARDGLDVPGEHVLLGGGVPVGSVRATI